MGTVSNLMISSCRTVRRPPCKLLCQTLHLATFHLPSESLIRRMPTVWCRWREWAVRQTKTLMTRLSSRSRWMILSISATNWRTHWTQFQTTLTCWMTVRLTGQTTTMKMMGRRWTRRGNRSTRTQGATWGYWTKAKSRSSTSHLTPQIPSVNKTALTIANEEDSPAHSERVRNHDKTYIYHSRHHYRFQ